MIRFFHKKPAQSVDNPRLGASPMDLREYDAFGPWIYPIRTPDDMPRRFRSYYDELQSATFFLKIPINADRAAMRPGMDLYRSVLAIYPDRIVALDWDGSELARRDIAMASIEAIRVASDLLPSVLTIYLAAGDVFRLNYNAVSSREIDKLVVFLRQGAVSSRPLSQGVKADWPGRANEEVGDFFFHGMWKEHVRQAPSTRIVHWDTPGINCRKHAGWGRSSLGCLMLDEGGDLVVINRGKFLRRWFEAVYSIATLHIPWAALRSVEFVQKPSGRQRFIPVLRLTLASHTFDLELFAPTGELHRLLATIHGVEGELLR